MSIMCGCKGAVNPFDECLYTPEATIFHVWSAQADSVQVLLMEGGEVVCKDMKKGRGDVWTAVFKGDHNGANYVFRTHTDGAWNETSAGVFAKAVSLNGDMGVVMDLRTTDPEGWDADVSPAFATPVVYELHHRDFSIDPSSGAAHPGKFLALTEPWSLSYLQDLGVTHVQILPSFDYGSIDESTLERNVYNWGYDPKNYNVPEGSYSSDPADPACRIREFKQMVMALHGAGLRVVMDVVYNHTYQTMGCALGRVNPGYFYRTGDDGELANGSGCGNETASEREMVRRFIVESVKYWHDEYHVDGFRFDLMGIHDIETMNAVRAALPADVLVYGEGWAAMAPAYPAELLAMKANMAQIPGVGAFSDDLRDVLVGSPFNSLPAFAAGAAVNVEPLKFGLAGGVEHPQVNGMVFWAAEPSQHVSYVTCHDNYCLRDRLTLSCPKATEAELLRMDKLAQTAVLTSQGMPFIFAGEELFRTKGGDENSFESPDSVNAIRWDNLRTYRNLFNYYKALIAIRKAHPAFWLGNAASVRELVSFPEAPDGCVAYFIDGDDPVMVLFNGTAESQTFDIPEGDYNVLACDGEASPVGLGNISGPQCRVKPLSATILSRI